MTRRRILFLSKGEDSASTRYRALQFFDHLSAAGFAPEHLAMAGRPDAYFRALRAARRADVVVVLRKTFPAALLWLLRKSSKRLIFDFDDAIFCNSDGSASSTRMSRFAAMARVADHITAGNNFLAEAASRCNRQVTIIPTCVEAEKYLVGSAKPEGHVDLVWIGSRSTRKYLEEILPVLEKAVQANPLLRLKIIADFSLESRRLSILPIPWSAEGEARELASAHIGLAPMRTDDWSKGKCALKVLQYMAAGLPVISSNAGANAEIVQAGKTGELASSDAEWLDAIARLSGNLAICNEYGTQGRRLVSECYAIDPVFSRLRTVLLSEQSG